LPGNPRAFFAQRGRENSLGDLSGSIGELRVPETQAFHNSIGDLRFNSSFGEYQAQEDFHNSCGEFHNSFGEFNSNGLGLASSGNNPMMNNNQNSLGEINPLTLNDSFGGPSDFHNSFGEYVKNDNRARAMAMARARANATPTASMMMNASEPRHPDMYRRSNSENFGQVNSGFNPGLPQMEPDYDALDLQPPSVPLSISVPSEQSVGNNNAIEREQFQLEFENSDIIRREREVAMRQQQQQLQQQRQQQQRRGVSIVDTLDTAGYSGRNHQIDEDPFEPVPVSDLNEMQMETIF
jgi:hypothetical protein